MQTVHAELYTRNNHWEKERVTDKTTGRMMHVGPLTLYTQVLPLILPGLPSLGDLTVKVEQQRVGREA